VTADPNFPPPPSPEVDALTTLLMRHRKRLLVDGPSGPYLDASHLAVVLLDAGWQPAVDAASDGAPARPTGLADIRARLDAWRQSALDVDDTVVTLARHLCNADYGPGADSASSDLYERRWARLDDVNRLRYLDLAHRDLTWAALLLRDRWAAEAYERGCTDERRLIAVDEQDFEASIRRDERAKVDAEWRRRVREHLYLSALAALRCIPDGEIRSGCVVHDGAAVRERLRLGYLALTRGPAESHADGVGVAGPTNQGALGAPRAAQDGFPTSSASSPSEFEAGING
jgi:hypothetical protein